MEPVEDNEYYWRIMTIAEDKEGADWRLVDTGRADNPQRAFKKALNIYCTYV